MKQKGGSKKGKSTNESQDSSKTNDDQEKPKKQRGPKHEKSTTKPESHPSTLASNKGRKVDSSTEQGKERTTISPKEKKKSASKPKPAAPNFKELLEMAERNRLGLNKVQHNKPSKSNETSNKKAIKDKLKPDLKKEVQQERQDRGKKVKTKELPTTKPTTSKTEQKSKPDKTRYSKEVANSKQPLKRPNPYTAPWQQSGSHRRPYSTGYYDNEDEDDMDGFIDDDEVDAGGDVSAHIREIFGYDRRRYRNNDE